MKFARFHSHNVEEESLPRTALVQVFGALWCSGVWLRLVQEGLVWACKPCIQPSSQTLQSHEWRAFSLFTLQIRLTKGLGGCGYKGVSALSLPFNLSVFSNSAPSHSVDNEQPDLATVRNILHEKLQTTNCKGHQMKPWDVDLSEYDSNF